MFGSIGGAEILFIFVLGLLLFGPRKLPEIGRTIGKTLAEFRRATSDFTTSLEREVALEKRNDEGAIAAPGPIAREHRDAVDALPPDAPTEPVKPPDA